MRRVHLDPSGFGIEVPSTWQLRADVSGLAVVAILPDQRGTRDNIGVIAEDTGHPDLTLERYVVLAIDLVPQQVDGFRLQECTMRTTANAEQALVEYTGRVHDHPRHFLAAVVMSEGRAFTATYTATEATFRSGLPVAQPVLHSLFAR